MHHLKWSWKTNIKIINQKKIKKYGDGLYFQLTLDGSVKKTLKVTKE